LLLAGIKMLADSPHYYASIGDFETAGDVLVHVRGGESEAVEQGCLEICAIAEDSKPSSPIQSAKVLIGRGEGKAAHLGRRAWLCLWLQIMASWTSTTAVTAYSPALLKQAGYSSLKQNGLAGGLNTIGIVGTIIGV
jgi:Sugar (and other) transporter